ncbi:hypothetical protein BDN70DRAFT_921462 [Pholiota conissans]|uniref:Uncharacterized protein n=1 Tax=Pholiota conissans TaxID=109636 RepID=A0A9P5Z1F7_9AGAR|nr:hypothetical protein BDN70DRAFT_921462 [Pholiota conissans]
MSTARRSSSHSTQFFDAADSVEEGHAGIGLSDPEVNRDIRKKLDIINKLKSTGVQIDIDLPQIAVIGNQSAGKSSLIESISGITLPRSSGTCTRTPTECQLIYTAKGWQCVISVRFIAGASGRALTQVHTEQFGDIIHDKSEVEERTRRAQRYALDPKKGAKHFLDPTNPHQEPLPADCFSENCVTLQISGPDVADLSFCDLPGLIASGAGDAIAKVENMVSSYIQKPSCIILLTVACETDFENQGAHRLAKKYDPEGKRTIGVLTKPDRIERGEENIWLPFITGEKERLDNHWFCVKQPSSHDLKSKMSWKQAREAESQFFSSAAPWSTLEKFRQFLGTSNLVPRLSNVLFRLITARMPQIKQELERAIRETRQQKLQLPPPPVSDPRTEILNLLHQFSKDLAMQIDGVPDSVDGVIEHGLIQAILPHQEKFKKAIRATGPFFVPFAKASSHTEMSRPDFLGNSMFPPQGQKFFADEVLERASRARTRELPGHFPFVVQKTFIQNVVKQWSEPSEALCDSVFDIVSKHAGRLVKKHFEHFGQGRLAQKVNFIVQEHVAGCRQRAKERLEWLHELEVIPFSLNDGYLGYYNTKFLDYYKEQREAHLKSSPKCGASPASTPPRADRPVVNPPSLFSQSTPTQNKPFAFDTKPTAPGTGTPAFGAQAAQSTAAPGSIFSSASGTSLFRAAQASSEATAHAKLDEEFKYRSALSELEKLGYNVTKDDLVKLRPVDPMEPALAIMADVSAYYHVAYPRFVDNVPLAIDAELVRGVEKDIMTVLYTKLGINGPTGDAICKDFAQEERKVAERRRELTTKLTRLESARGELF